jgi:hypothetical protein
MTRPWTESTSTTIVMKRACNGCGQRLGDVTDQEIACGRNRLPLPDVRRECPTCAPTAPEPKCLPTIVVAGDQLWVEMECDHTGGGVHAVTEQTICLTHSEIDANGVITRPEPWPCQRAKAVTA